jgi:two-component system, cell cycle sensor histidine kinase and response regulator CckA
MLRFATSNKRAPKPAPASGSRALRGGFMLMLSILATAAAGMLAIWLLPAIGQIYSGAMVLGVGAVSYLAARLAIGRGQKQGQVSALPATAMNDSPEGRLIVGPEGQVAFANRAYREMAGVAADAGGDGVRVPVLAELFPGEGDIGERLRRLERAARAGHGGRDELALRDAEGKARWLSIDAYALAGAPGHVAWDISDTTLWREVQSAIQDEQDKLADFIDNAPVGFYSIDQDGRFSFVNRTLAGWLGLSPEELTGGRRLIADIMADASEAAALVPSAAGQLARECDVTLKGRDGSTRQVRITQSASADAGDGRLRTRSVARDLTDELGWREALRQAEAHFSRFFQAAPIGILVLDADNRVSEANGAFRQLTDIGDSTQVSLLDLVRKDDRPDLRARLAQARRGEAQAAPLEARLLKNERVVHVYVGSVDPGGGGGDRLLLHLIDVSEQKRLEVQFAQSQKMQAIGQLAGGIAHDFNNLLTAMIGFCDLLLLRYQPGDQSFADVMQIKQNANRAANLVRQLLAFSRQQTLRPKVLAVTDVLADLRNLLGRLIGERIELRMVHGRDLYPVKVDHGQLEQVIINLAVNARDAMANAGVLTIRTANVNAEESQRLGHDLMPPGEYVLIEVADTGKGIAKEHLGKIFEPFFTTKEVGAGTGLGLSTVYGIVKQTGGFIFPESEVGKGATFRIYLPRYRQQAGETETAAQPVKAQSRDLTGKGTVLLVEDEDAVRTFAARALRNKGYTVLEASSGEAALELVNSAQHSIDLLVSDVVMPNMDGPTLAQRVLESHPLMKIIFISGYAEDAFRKNPQTPRDINFLPKPFSLSQLAGKVKEVISAGR